MCNHNIGANALIGKRYFQEIILFDVDTVFCLLNKH